MHSTYVTVSHVLPPFNAAGIWGPLRCKPYTEFAAITLPNSFALLHGLVPTAPVTLYPFNDNAHYMTSFFFRTKCICTGTP